MKKHHSISPEVKEQILQRIKNQGVPVSQAAKEHGLHESTIYAWLRKGLKSMPTMGELVRLKRQNEEQYLLQYLESARSEELHL